MDSKLNQEGRRCLLEAFESGTPATFVSRMTSIEGNPIVRVYAISEFGGVLIRHDARLDTFSSGRIELLRCAGLVPVAEWNRAMNDEIRAELVFVEDRCEPIAN